MSRTAAPSANTHRRTIIYVTIGVLIVAAIVAVALASRVPKAATNAPVTKANLKVGDTAPDFAVQTNNGPFALKDVTSPVFLEVFATWCPHCQRMTVVLDHLAKKYAGKVAFVGVSGSPYAIDGSSPASLQDVQAFAQRFGVNYPLAYDPELTVAHEYLQTGFPTMVLIGTDKKIETIKDGEVAEAELDKALAAAH